MIIICYYKSIHLIAAFEKKTPTLLKFFFFFKYIFYENHKDQNQPLLQRSFIFSVLLLEWKMKFINGHIYLCSAYHTQRFGSTSKESTTVFF